MTKSANKEEQIKFLLSNGQSLPLPPSTPESSPSPGKHTNLLVRDYPKQKFMSKASVLSVNDRVWLEMDLGHCDIKNLRTSNVNLKTNLCLKEDKSLFYQNLSEIPKQKEQRKRKYEEDVRYFDNDPIFLRNITKTVEQEVKRAKRKDNSNIDLPDELLLSITDLPMPSSP